MAVCSLGPAFASTFGFTATKAVFFNAALAWASAHGDLATTNTSVAHRLQNLPLRLSERSLPEILTTPTYSNLEVASIAEPCQNRRPPNRHQKIAHVETDEFTVSASSAHFSSTRPNVVNIQSFLTTLRTWIVRGLLDSHIMTYGITPLFQPSIAVRKFSGRHLGNSATQLHNAFHQTVSSNPLWSPILGLLQSFLLSSADLLEQPRDHFAAEGPQSRPVREMQRKVANP